MSSLFWISRFLKSSLISFGGGGGRGGAHSKVIPGVHADDQVNFSWRA